MKKKVFRERYYGKTAEEVAKEVGEALNPLMKAMIESKKCYKPRRVKQKGDK